MNALETKHLSLSFGKLQAVNDVSLNVDEGERRVIIGPNGAGKTTLFNLITGLLSPTAGQVYIFGRNTTNLPPHRRIPLGMARTFQVTSLLVDLPVFDNILLAIQALKPFRFDMFHFQSTYGDLMNEAQVLLEQWGLWQKQDMLIRNLAYGEQRLVELIMALASKPRLLLLDEPTAGMTLAESAHITDAIRGLGKSLTVLVISHDLDLVFGLDPDRITVIHYGQIVAEGSPEEIKGNSAVREIYLGGKEET